MAARDLPIERFIFPKLSISRFLDDETCHDQILQLVAEGVGGFVCFDGNLQGVADSIAEIRAYSDHPLIFAADCEFGTAMRFPDGTTFPPMMGLAVDRDPDFVERVATAIGREMRVVGLDWNLAPVLDVNTNPDNPIINVRAFGDDAAIVAELGSAYVRGLQSAGILGCGKHLPGHGDTEVDSHIGLPVSSLQPDRIDKVELHPFRAAVQAGVESLMTAHLVCPALGDPVRPVSLSAPAISGLRRALGFDGVLITDALDMGALGMVPGMSKNIAVEAFIAGNDVVEMPVDSHASVEAMREAESSGVITPERIAESSRRLAGLYDRLAEYRTDRRHPGERAMVLEGNRTLARRAAARAIRFSGEPIPGVEESGDWYLFSGPMDEENRDHVIDVLDGVTPSDARSMKRVGESGVRLRTGDPAAPAIVLLCYSPRGGAGRVNLSEEDLQSISGGFSREAWVITFGNPYPPDGLRVRGQVDLFSAGPASLQMLPAIVTGRYRP